MQDRVGDREHPFGAELASGWPKKRHHFSGAPALVLMRVQDRMPFWLPGGSRLRDGLIRPRFILAKLHDPGRFPLLVLLLDPSFFRQGKECGGAAAAQCSSSEARKA